MKLIDVCELIVDCPHSTANDEGTGYPLIRTPNVGKGRLILDGVHRVSKEVYDARNARAIPQPGDLILAREAPAGNVALIQDGQQVCLGQRTVLIRPDKTKVYPAYLVYYMLAPYAQHELKSAANGATVAHVNMPKIRGLNIDLPEMSEQIRIGDILSAYDDLIATNQKQIALLEEAAQRIYKEWFINFHFPGLKATSLEGGVPVGWRKDCADAFFDITIGKTPPRAESRWFVESDGIPWLSISDMGNSGTFVFKTNEQLTVDAVLNHNVKVVKEGTIFVSFKLTVGKVSIATTPMCTNEAIAHFRIEDNATRDYAFWYLKNFEYDTLGNTSSISQAVNSKIIKAMPFILPDKQTIQSFSDIVSPMMNNIRACQETCLRATEARDILLPILLSGNHPF